MNSNIVIWNPKNLQAGKKNLEEFIAFARDQLTLYADQEDEYGKGWYAGKWRTTHQRSIAMVFGYSTNPYKIDRLFDVQFMEFAKAFVRQDQTIHEAKNVGDWLFVFRILHDLLKDMNDELPVSIMNLDEGIQIRFEETIKLSNVADQKKYHFGGKFESLCKWLIEKEILPILVEWKNPFKRAIDKIEQLDDESKKWREERCPTMHQMFSLADCFARATSVKDRFYTSLLVLLSFAPGRGDEVRNLTIDSLQQEDGRYYVSWYGGKGYGETKKWVPTVMVDILKEAFRRLIQIGSPARNAAKFAFENPDKFMIHEDCITPSDFDETAPLTVTQFAKAMGLAHLSPTGRELQWNVYKQTWITDLRKTGEVTYSKLGKLAQNTYKSKGWPLNPKTGRPVWETLCLVRDNELRDDFHVKKFSWTDVSVNQINDQLGKRIKCTTTLWERFDIKDEDGSDISLTSHQLRVWLNTHAMNGGMDDYLLAMWSGRADISQNKAYDGRTEGEKDQLKNQIMLMDHKSPPNPLALFTSKLPVPLPTLGIDREGVADFTGLGFCVHNFAQSPCTKAGECITCKEHVCMKGLPDTLENLEQLELLIAEQFESAKKAATDLTFGADRWVTHLGWKLIHIRSIIESLKSPNLPIGALIRIPVAHDPSPTRRVLRSKGKITDLTNSASSTQHIEMQLKLLGEF